MWCGSTSAQGRRSCRFIGPCFAWLFGLVGGVAWQIDLPVWSWGSVAGQGMDFAGKSRSCALFCLLGIQSDLVLMSFQGLLCNPAIVCFINTSTLYSRVVMYLLRHLFAWEVFPYRKQQTEDLGSAGRQRDNLALLLGVCPCSLLLDGLLTEILPPSVVPLCLLADELDLSKLFFCSWKNPHLQIQLLKNPVRGCRKHFNFLVMFNLEKFWLFFLEF